MAEATGLVDDGTYALEWRVEAARRIWIEGDASNFEPVDKRRWRDKATGTLYRKVRG